MIGKTRPFVFLACLCPPFLVNSVITDDYNGSDLIAWIKSHSEGIVHPSVEIRREVPGDKSSLLGLYVSSGAEAIEKGDVIARVPWDRIIRPPYDSYDKSSFWSCRSIWSLHKELEKGDKSNFAPYVTYLSAIPRGMTPGDWSDAGRRFLAESILGSGELPPFEDEWRDEYQSVWAKKCGGSSHDPLQRQAYFLASSRDEDTLMVPLYDMMNHSNDPKKLNTVSYKPEEAGHAFRFVARRKIEPGEQIYNSYNRCGICSDVPQEECETFSYHRTPDIFAIFGFVEELPQSWVFTTDAEYDDDNDDDGRNEVEFCLEEDSESGKLVVLWDEEDLPEPEDVSFLWREAKRLKDVLGEKEELEKEWVQPGNGDEDEQRMPRTEWDAVWAYHGATIRALGAVIVAAEDAGVTDGVNSVAKEIEKLKTMAKDEL